jgi:anaerobic selenocysteine-containing dehydrogenase
MNLKRILGLDTLEEKYSYASDPLTGYTSTQKIPDRWVATTCGYCSVGCGMFIGVKDGRAVSVRGNPDHASNFGTLCPKGLSEHYILEAQNRAFYPLLRKNGRLERASWDDALRTMAGAFRGVQQKYGPDAVGILSTGQLVTEEFYTLGKLAQLGLGTKNYDGNTTLCMASAVSGYKRSFGIQPGQDAHRGRSPRDENRHDGRPAPTTEAALGHRAHQRHDSPADRTRSREPGICGSAHDGLRRT